MGVVFSQGDILSRGDLDAFFSNSSGNPTNLFEITYAIYYVDPTSHVEIPIGSAARIPVNPAVGEYYAALQVPASASVGDYRIRWTFREFAGAPQQVIVQEWGVVAAGTTTGPVLYTAGQTDMIWKLRVFLRDQNPDKFYKFRPPEAEGSVGQYNQVFGQIWEDDELLMYLEAALDWFNMFPPETEAYSSIDMLVQHKPVWRTAVIWGAITHACTALALNWISDEFQYSCGGISLDLEKSSKYESIKQNAEGQFDKATEAKARTTKYVRGLKQQRFGMGVRSSFGANTGRGILSPRSFVGG